MERLRSWCYASRFFFFRQLRSRRMFLSVLVIGLVLAVVIVAGISDPWSMRTFGNHVVLGIIGLFVLPTIALVFGTGPIGNARDEKTLVYLLVRPISRWGLFTAMFVGVAPLALLFFVGGLWVLSTAAATFGEPELREAFGLYVRFVCLGGLAYLSLFFCMGAVFRHASLIAVAYVFFVEFFLGNVPGVMKRITIRFYVWCLFYETSDRSGIELQDSQIFLPVDGETAATALIGMTLGFVAVGALAFSLKEYRDVG